MRSIVCAARLGVAVVAGLLLPPQAAAQNWFSAPRVFKDLGNALCHGDIDQDGDVDVLIFQFPNLVVPQLNDGSGDFTTGTSFALPASAHYALQPVLADLDGDGRLDLVVGTFVAPDLGVYVYPGLQGGLFATPVLVPIAAQPSHLALGDFNADGRVDVACGIGAGGIFSLVWIHHDGLGYLTTPSPLSGPAAIVDIATGDLDGDGRDDAAVTFVSAESVAIALSPAGGLTTGPSFVLDPTDLSIGVTAGDFDGDGDTDVLTAARVPFQDGALRLQPILQSGGGLALGTAQVLNYQNAGSSDFPLEPTALDSADFDADGDLDVGAPIVFPITSTIGARFTLLENVGAATFTHGEAVPVEQFGVGAGFADFDGDGHMDFCASHAIVFGDGSTQSPLSSDISINDLVPLRVTDIEGDGDVDLVDFTFNGTGASSMLLNDGTGEFTATANLFPSPAAGLAYRNTHTRGDFDGDGRLDILAELWQLSGMIFVPDTYLGTRLVRDDHTGHYVDAGPAAAPATLFLDTAPVLADIDGNGAIDVLNGIGVALNDGSGFFGNPLPPLPGKVLDVADVDGDGDLDVLLSAAGQVRLARQQPGFTFSSETLLQKQLLLVGSRFLDVDQDGDADVVVPFELSTQPTFELAFIEVLINSGGSFSSAATLNTGTRRARQLATADVDGDGITDLIGTTLGGGAMVALRRSGPGFTFEPYRQFLTNNVAAFADIDADGDVDLIGRGMSFSRVFEGAAAGRIRQYGSGKPGSGGAVPILGAQGPAKAGSTTYQLRLRRGLGGGTALLLLSTGEAALPNLPLLGMTLYVDVPLLLVVPLPLGGAAGAAGDGEFTIPAALPPSLIGLSLYHQTLHPDSGAQFGAAASNGLEVTFGG